MRLMIIMGSFGRYPVAHDHEITMIGDLLGG
jgi:hypothetical protein